MDPHSDLDEGGDDLFGDAEPSADAGAEDENQISTASADIDDFGLSADWALGNKKKRGAKSGLSGTFGFTSKTRCPETTDDVCNISQTSQAVSSAEAQRQTFWKTTNKRAHAVDAKIA